jgi:hypothetical protein
MAMKSSTDPQPWLTSNFTNDWLFIIRVTHNAGPFLQYLSVFAPLGTGELA